MSGKLFIRASGLLSPSKRCRSWAQDFWPSQTGRLSSTSQPSTKSRDVNADLSFVNNQREHPAAHTGAYSPPQHSQAYRTFELTPIHSGRRRRPDRTTAMLDPARLDSGCFLDVSGCTYVHIYDRTSSLRLLSMAYTVSGKGSVPGPFLPGTHGFLYFHPDAHNPLQSQIRFRVTQDHDPSRSFSSGHDLTYGSGFTWHIPLTRAAQSPKLREMLVRDGLIDNALVAQLQARPLSRLEFYRLKRSMSVLDQPFIFDFTNRTLSFVVRVAGQVRRYHTDGPLRYYLEKDKYLVHEAGSALCRLERSTLPQHAGRRIVVMRLLKIVRPPKRRLDVPPTCNLNVPVEGELFARGQRVWYRDVDKPAKPGKGAEILRLLYDASDDGKQASGQSS